MVCHEIKPTIIIMFVIQDGKYLNSLDLLTSYELKHNGACYLFKILRGKLIKQRKVQKSTSRQDRSVSCNNGWEAQIQKASLVYPTFYSTCNKTIYNFQSRGWFPNSLLYKSFFTYYFEEKKYDFFYLVPTLFRGQVVEVSDVLAWDLCSIIPPPYS